MEQDTSKQTESRYNMNESNFVLLGELQTEAFRYMNNKDFNRAMDRWQSIRFIVQSVFKETERETLDEIEEEFGKPLSFSIPERLNEYKIMGSKFSPKQIFVNNVFKIHKQKQIKIYINTLTGFLRTYKISMTDLDKKKKLS